MKVTCFTSFTYCYLDRALLLARSVKKFHPDWRMCAVISDEPPDTLEGLKIGYFDDVLNLVDILQSVDPAWLFSHNVVELCTAVKGVALTTLLAQDADAVVYLDPDIVLINPLNEMIEDLRNNAIILTPHILKAEKFDSAIIDNEIGTLKYGIFNLGFLAVKNSVDGNFFAKWWSDRLMKFCRDDVPAGLFTDQRWCDLVPVLFRNVKISRDSGMNVASWNLSNRALTTDADGNIVVNGKDRLKFFHFTKINHVGMMMLERYSSGNELIFELIGWYKRSLQEMNEKYPVPGGWWKYAFYNNGEKISDEHRRTYRGRSDLIHAFSDPYDPEGFLSWFNANS